MHAMALHYMHYNFARIHKLTGGGTASLEDMALSLNAWMEDWLAVREVIAKFPFCSDRAEALR